MLIFKPINQTWKLGNDILPLRQILNEHTKNNETMIVPEKYDEGVEASIKLMSEGTHVSFCIEAALRFAALKISPLEKSSKILDSHEFWYSDPGSNNSLSNMSSSSVEGNGGSMWNLAANLFVKLTDVLRETSLVRQDEIQNQAVAELHECFATV